MDWLEFLAIVIIVAAAFFLIYYYFRGAKGDIALTRPVESRVDEYLDRRFESLVEEWELVNHPKLQRFKEQKSKELEQDEARLADLKKFELDLENSLTTLESRLDSIEKGLVQKEEAPKSKDASQDRFSDLKKDIVVMRKQGQPPVKDPNTFAQYVCDLCSTDHPISVSASAFSADAGPATPAGRMSSIRANPVPDL